MQPLLAGAIPVYLGAPNIAEFAPGPHSFLDIRQFESPGMFLVAVRVYR